MFDVLTQLKTSTKLHKQRQLLNRC